MSTVLPLPKQFLIAKDVPSALENWKSHHLLDWSIAASDEVPVISFNSSDAPVHGYLLGWVIHEGTLLSDGSHLDLKDPLSSGFQEALCGRYILLYAHHGKTYVRTDAGGLLPLVYSNNPGAAASTPTTLGIFQPLEADEELQRTFRIGERFGWFAFGLTPYRNVTRLIPHHELCLESWKVTRYWPKTAVDEPRLLHGDDEAGKQTRLIADLVSENVAAVISGGRGIAHLTAGYDSRMVIAATVGYRNQCFYETVTAAGPDGRPELDSHVAAIIAKKLHLNHEFVEFVENSPEDTRAWLARTGYCVFDHVTNLAATAEHHDRHYHALTGTCGEVGRAYYWGDGVENIEDVSIGLLLEKLGMPKTEAVVSAAKNWLTGLPVKGTSLFWDLAYIEQRLGCWAGPSVFGHNVSFPSLSPFNSHEIYRMMLSLPEDYRKSQQFSRDFIGYLWPDLLGFPFNRAVGLSKRHYLKSEIVAMLPPGIISLLKRVRRIL